MMSSFEQGARVGSRSVGVDPRLLWGAVGTVGTVAFFYYVFFNDGWGVNSGGRTGLAGALADAWREKAEKGVSSTQSTDPAPGDEDGHNRRTCVSLNKDGSRCLIPAEPNSIFCGVHGGR